VPPTGSLNSRSRPVLRRHVHTQPTQPSICLPLHTSYRIRTSCPSRNVRKLVFPNLAFVCGKYHINSWPGTFISLPIVSLSVVQTQVPSSSSQRVHTLRLKHVSLCKLPTVVSLQCDGRRMLQTRRRRRAGRPPFHSTTPRKVWQLPSLAPPGNRSSSLPALIAFSTIVPRKVTLRRHNPRETVPTCVIYSESVLQILLQGTF
jgi:hypothetical protein